MKHARYLQVTVLPGKLEELGLEQRERAICYLLEKLHAFQSSKQQRLLGLHRNHHQDGLVRNDNPSNTTSITPLHPLLNPSVTPLYPPQCGYHSMASLVRRATSFRPSLETVGG